jgi:radical SAM protein with 4Fe4S-binding SPASM domain
MRKALEITTRKSCPLRCVFCPQSKLAAAYEGKDAYLTMPNFVLALTTVPKDVEIHASGFTEPFFNDLAAKFALTARQAGHPVHVFTTLMGLQERMLPDLADSKPDHIRIHVPDQKAMIIPDGPWIRQHELFRKSGLTATYMAMGELTPRIHEYLLDLGIKVELPTMLSRAGNLGWTAANRPIKGPLTCKAERYWMHVMLPDGTVVGCSMLYSLEVVLGNLFKQPYSEIEAAADKWAADKNPPEDSPCRKCCWATPI